MMAWNLDAISTFDPAQINAPYGNEVFVNVCDNLVEPAKDNAAKFVPSLAKSWDVFSDD
ncbi:ABC-type transport system substrate-binding protein [Bartonella callosciuri]|uniref:ABC-type transport system substrate-binding protein n=1 Tax=Bartonella callosciuri TaxID=686223 RepID=A0A840NVG7_9HYPH|nr:ABC-type transport system substrate-binding protein [Bartonella callosciuri]